jgi:hypothetical protein
MIDDRFTIPDVETENVVFEQKNEEEMNQDRVPGPATTRQIGEKAVDRVNTGAPKGRRKTKHYPPDWGISPEHMSLRKRCLYLHVGPQRIWKDEMLLHRELELRVPLPLGQTYVTDLDIETLRTAEAIYMSHTSAP